MLIEYIQAALKRATYRILGNNEGYFGEIPGFQGVWSNADTLEACREELREVLEDWILIKVRHNDADLPAVDGLDLNPQPVEQEVA
jgi:predicted RNase H-like HicB family nuclease